MPTMNAVYTMQRVGLGTQMQRVIHRALDATPMPARLRRRIKNCPGCGRRRAWLDRLTTRQP